MSFGTGHAEEDPDEEPPQGYSASELVEVLTDGPIEATDYVMRQVLGEGFVSLRVPLPPARMAMDDGRPENLRSLQGLGRKWTLRHPDPMRRGALHLSASGPPRSPMRWLGSTGSFM